MRAPISQLALAAVTAATVVAIVAACTPGGDTSPAPTSGTSASSPPAANPTDQAALAAVTVTGGPGAKPTITLPSVPFSVASQVARIVDQGTGQAVAAGGLVRLDIVQVSGTDGTELAQTWSNGPGVTEVVDSEAFFDQLYQLILSMRVGSRALVAGPSTDPSGAPITEVDLLEVIGTATVLPHADGAPVAARDGLPTVFLDGTGKPSLSPTTAAAPAKLVAQPLIAGTGPVLASGQAVAVHYTGWLWDGTQFDSSWDRDTPMTIQAIGRAEVIPGWDQGLVGQHVGSQVLLVVPPDLGYGPNVQANVPPNSTLVFVVDILAAI